VKPGINIKHLLILVLFGYLFFFYGLGDYSLKEPDEGRYAEIPREMLELQDYVVPHLNYVRYFEKPPLFYWAVALSYKIFGINEYGFRFANAFFAMLTVFLLYFFSRRWFHEKVALLASLILASSLGFFAMARIVTLDMCFTCFLCLALMAFFNYYKEGKRFSIYLFYAATALATLAKGPVAVILLGGSLFLFLLTLRDIAFLKKLKWGTGLAIYCLITVPWFLAIALREKEFLYFFFVDQHFLRFLTSQHKRTGAAYYFVPVLFAGMLPWSVFVPRSVALLWRRPELRLFFIWSAVVFLFFTLSKSKLPPYILPLFPALSLIIGWLFHEKWKDLVSRATEGTAYLVLFLLFASFWLINAHPFFADLLLRMSDEAPEIAKVLKPSLIALSCCSAFFAAMLLTGRIRRYSHLFLVNLGFSFAILVLILFNVGLLDRVNTTKPLAAYINEKKGTFDYLVNAGSYDQTLPFYTQQRTVSASYTWELEMGSKYDDAKGYFISFGEYSRILPSDKKVLSVISIRKLAMLQKLFPAHVRVLLCMGERCLISNY